MEHIKESDWKVLRKHLPQWQEDFIAVLLREYREILNQPVSTAERFWTLEKRIREDRKLTGVVVTDLRRSRAYETIASLLVCKAISEEDLCVFSEETQEIVKQLYHFWDD